MIYGITDGDEHLKSILTQRLGLMKFLKDFKKTLISARNFGGSG